MSKGDSSGLPPFTLSAELAARAMSRGRPVPPSDAYEAYFARAAIQARRVLIPDGVPIRERIDLDLHLNDAPVREYRLSSADIGELNWFAVPPGEGGDPIWIIRPVPIESVRPAVLIGEGPCQYACGLQERYFKAVHCVQLKATEYDPETKYKSKVCIDALRALGGAAEFEIDVTLPPKSGTKVERDAFKVHGKRPLSPTKTANLISVCPCLPADVPERGGERDRSFLSECFLPALFRLGNVRVIPNGHIVLVVEATDKYLDPERLNIEAIALTYGWHRALGKSEVINLHQLVVESNGLYEHTKSGGEEVLTRNKKFIRFVFERTVGAGIPADTAIADASDPTAVPHSGLVPKIPKSDA